MVIIAARTVIKYAQHAMEELPQIVRLASQVIIRTKIVTARDVIAHA